MDKDSLLKILKEKLQIDNDLEAVRPNDDSEAGAQQFANSLNSARAIICCIEKNGNAAHWEVILEKSEGKNQG